MDFTRFLGKWDFKSGCRGGGGRLTMVTTEIFRNLCLPCDYPILIAKDDCESGPLDSIL